MTFDVRGMTCSACSGHVEKSVRKLDGIHSISVSLLTNSMQVSFDAPATPASICHAVAQAGYGASPKDGGKAEKAEAPQSPKIAGRLIASIALLIPLMYVSMGHPMGDWPVPAFLENPAASGL